MDFNITAGDVLNVSIDVLAKSMSGPTSGTISYTTPEKLITWDKVSVEVSGGYFLTKIQGFSLSINNNAAYIYTGKPNGSGSATDKESLFPYDIRLGTQEVSGSVMVYLDQGEEFIPIVLANPYTIKFILPGLTITMPVVFNSQNLAGVVGPVITTIPFVGVDKALGA